MTTEDPSTRTQPLPEGAAVVAATEQWFVKHGLPYFVPEEREGARSALHSRRTAVMLAATVLLTLAAGVSLAFVVEDAALAPATLMTIVGVAALFYAATALRARSIAAWAVSRTLSSLRLLFPLVTRALPLLLLFVTFLFINAEVWEVSAGLDGAVLWVTVMLFGLFALGFLFVRLPEELEQIDGLGDDTRFVDACRGTPLEDRARIVIEEQGRETVAAQMRVQGFEKANLVLVLAIAQAVQVLLLSVSVFAFFMLFGGVVMSEDIQKGWTGAKEVGNLPGTNLSLELFQVSVFLAAFSGLYFTVYAVTDEAYRDQFFTQVKKELERAVAVRAVYLTMRGRAAP